MGLLHAEVVGEGFVLAEEGEGVEALLVEMDGLGIGAETHLLEGDVYLLVEVVAVDGGYHL